ncbi:hypothetical protein HL658_04675 [Azospirillum sp. RWY-5-1]|uniref:Uncharacterized protein n=1 Tax=Azospirillum oleiclasticum TaxID=2735135 RepID=A0ABX2T7S7_9PROT|nr:hypothetical protein [Azospirillum oleiclasticum]NYZ11834.1 hypothetical protein [Azospirillum oleiclasticum]NYZ18994.1 hypothetical protein [Azospirillum oleiclasticum]
MIDGLIEMLWRTAELGLLVMLPVIVLSLGERLIHAVDVIRYHEVPGLARFSVLSGLIAGALLLYANHEREWYEFDTVFDPDGPWAVPLPQLFTLWLNPLRYSPQPLLHHIAPLDYTDTATVLAGLSTGLAGLAVFGSVRYFGMKAPLAMLANIVIWLWGAGLAIYMVCAGAWALNMLNFWAVVIGFLVYRYYHLKAAAH